MARRTRGGFEEKLRELEALVRRMEDGAIPLEESLDLFERGIRLSRELQASLKQASMRVTRLLEQETPAEVPYGEPGEEGGRSGPAPEEGS